MAPLRPLDYQTLVKLFQSSRLAPPNPMKGELVRKLTKEQKRDIAAIAAK